LPHGAWFDFWTNTKRDGGREISRDVDLDTLPLYVRAGAIVPMGPLKQFTGEQVDGPLTFTVYPGADGRFSLYDDDGESFDFRSGAFMRVELQWNDRSRRLTLKLADRSRMLSPGTIPLEIRVAGAAQTKKISFDGKPASVTL
jgi:alpha-glucosidase (family GH31 glycosyl hydrolase)